MRATSLPLPALHAAFGRRGLFALFVGAMLTTTLSPTSVAAFDGLSLLPQFEQFVLAQQPKPKKVKPTPKAQVAVDPALKRDKTALPPDYKIPPEKLPDIDIIKELPVPVKKDAKDPEWKKHVDKMKLYAPLLRRGTFADEKADRDILRYGIQFKLARMTQRSILFPTDEDRAKIQKAQEEEKRPVAPDTIDGFRDTLLKDLDDTNASGQFAVRDAFLEILCEEAPKLLDNNYYVRFNVALMLSTVNGRDRDPAKGIPEDVPCFKAAKPLLNLVNDPKLHATYKFHPVQALARICRHKNCSVEDRFSIIESLIKQMAIAKPLPEWYGMRLVESLALLGDPNDRTRQPVVVDALVKVLKDTGFSFRIRSQAAHSLGRVPLEGYRKADEIAIEMLRLGDQMAVEYEKTKTDPMWKLHFWYLYLGFHPKDAAERAEKKGLLVQVDSKPALAATKTVVTEAYQLYLPLVQTVLGGKATAPIPDQLRKIKVWLDAKGKAAGPGTPVAKDGN